MGIDLAFQKQPHNSEMVLENSDAERLLTSHRDGWDTTGNNPNNIHLTVLVIETSQNFMPKGSLNGL